MHHRAVGGRAHLGPVGQVVDHHEAAAAEAGIGRRLPPPTVVAHRHQQPSVDHQAGDEVQPSLVRGVGVLGRVDQALVRGQHDVLDEVVRKTDGGGPRHEGLAHLHQPSRIRGHVHEPERRDGGIELGGRRRQGHGGLRGSP